MASTIHEQPTSESGAIPSQLLLSADLTELLAIMDIFQYDPLWGRMLPPPQITVYGGQSSGRSSALEALSGWPFPKGDNSTRLFTTRLRLRRTSTVSVSVSVEPAPSRNDQERARMVEFSCRSYRADDFQALVRIAIDFLRAEGNLGSSPHVDDILHIEVNHPSLTPLTLMELPECRYASDSGAMQQDFDTVSERGRWFLGESSIILAFISAQSYLDLKGEGIMKTLTDPEVDPHGQKTLGVIMEDPFAYASKLRALVDYAKNSKHRLELGWHVVRVPPLEGQHATLGDRDAEEAISLASGAWTTILEQDQLGFASLRTRLINTLEAQTRKALSTVIVAIERSLSWCDGRLKSLGPPRSAPKQQADYLVNISQQFRKICEQSLDGTYEDNDFFGEVESDKGTRRLRATVRNLNDGFATIMRARGHRREIVDGGFTPAPELRSKLMLRPRHSMLATAWLDVDPPVPISRDRFIQEIDELARSSRSTEGPWLLNHRLIPRLFRQQSERWEAIANEHIVRIRDTAQECLELIAAHVATDETAKQMRRHLIAPEMQRRHDEALKQLKKLLRPNQRDIIVTLDDELIKNLRKLRIVESTPSESPSMIFATNGCTRQSDSPYTVSYMLDYMLAYYKSAMRTFMENVANLAVEQCLLDGLEGIIPATMNDELMNVLASESDVAKEERASLLKRRQKLEDVLRICKLHCRQTAASSQPHQRKDTEPQVTVTGAQGSSPTGMRKSRKTTPTGADRVGTPSLPLRQSGSTDTAPISDEKPKIMADGNSSKQINDEALLSAAVPPTLGTATARANSPLFDFSPHSSPPSFEGPTPEASRSSPPTNSVSKDTGSGKPLFGTSCPFQSPNTGTWRTVGGIATTASSAGSLIGSSPTPAIKKVSAEGKPVMIRLPPSPSTSTGENPLGSSGTTTSSTGGLFGSSTSTSSDGAGLFRSSTTASGGFSFGNFGTPTAPFGSGSTLPNQSKAKPSEGA